METSGDIGDVWASGSARAASFDAVGDYYEGVIVEYENRQLLDDDDDPEVWPDGNPKYTPVVTIQTKLQADDEDDGRRALYCRTGLFLALRDCMRASFSSKPTNADILGGWLHVKFTRTTEPKKRSFSPGKVYEMTFRKKED